MNKQEKIRRKNEVKKAKKARRQAKKEAAKKLNNFNTNTIDFGTGVKQTEILPGMMLTTWDDSKCLRMIGYDAFEHFGLTHEEVDFLTSFGDWTCFVDSKNDSKEGNRYSYMGTEQGDSDEKFVFATALDVLTSIVAINVAFRKIDTEIGNKYVKLVDKMALKDKEIFKWYFTTNPNFPKYAGDFSDFTVKNCVHAYCNETSHYAIITHLKERYGISPEEAEKGLRVSYSNI